jgi:hypothetical protein
MQAGLTIPVSAETGDVGDHAIVRLLMPNEGCTPCQSLIDAMELATDMHPAKERARRRGGVSWR